MAGFLFGMESIFGLGLIIVDLYLMTYSRKLSKIKIIHYRKLAEALTYLVTLNRVLGLAVRLCQRCTANPLYSYTGPAECQA